MKFLNNFSNISHFGDWGEAEFEQDGEQKGHEMCEIFYTSPFSSNIKIYQKNAKIVTCLPSKTPFFAFKPKN